jgi:hypothetical protein
MYRVKEDVKKVWVMDLGLLQFASATMVMDSLSCSRHNLHKKTLKQQRGQRNFIPGQCYAIIGQHKMILQGAGNG